MLILEDGLNNVDTTVAELQGKLNVATRSAASLEIDMKIAMDEIQSSEALFAALENEYQRWKTEVLS